MITDEQGCSAIDTLNLFIDDFVQPLPNVGYYFPSIFSPNGELVDQDYILGIDPDVFKAFEFYLYDRWGNLVVESVGDVNADSITLWDGKYDAKPAESGVYVFVAKLLYSNDVEVRESGHITLLR